MRPGGRVVLGEELMLERLGCEANVWKKLGNGAIVWCVQGTGRYDQIAEWEKIRDLEVARRKSTNQIVRIQFKLQF